MSIFSRFGEPGESRFIPRLSAKTRVQPFVLGIDLQQRKTSKIELIKFDRKSSVEAACKHSLVGFDSRGRSVERLGATRGDFGWLGRPRSIGKTGLVARLDGVASAPMAVRVCVSSWVDKRFTPLSL